jgi:hypothetical protein
MGLDDPFCQRNEVHALVPLGSGGETIGTAGCLVCGVTKALSQLTGAPYTPPRVVQLLDAHDGFLGSRLVWAALDELPGLHLVERREWPSTVPLEDLAHLVQEHAAGRKVLLRVDCDPFWRTGLQEHWVLLEEVRPTVYAPYPWLFLAYDPWTGQSGVDVGARYSPLGERDLGYAVWAAAVLAAEVAG